MPVGPREFNNQGLGIATGARCFEIAIRAQTGTGIVKADRLQIHANTFGGPNAALQPVGLPGLMGALIAENGRDLGLGIGHRLAGFFLLGFFGDGIGRWATRLRCRLMRSASKKSPRPR